MKTLFVPPYVAARVRALSSTNPSSKSFTYNGMRFIETTMLPYRPKTCRLERSKHWPDEFTDKWNNWAMEMFGKIQDIVIFDNNHGLPPMPALIKGMIADPPLFEAEDL